MKPKFNVGDVVKVIWRPKEVRNFPAWFFKELENKQIISSIDTNEGFPQNFTILITSKNLAIQNSVVCLFMKTR